MHIDTVYYFFKLSCREKATGNFFVAKVIDTPMPLDKAAVRNEVSIMNQLHHPKLINLHDAFEGDYDMILVLEMCAKDDPLNIQSLITE